MYRPDCSWLVERMRRLTRKSVRAFSDPFTLHASRLRGTAAVSSSRATRTRSRRRSRVRMASKGARRCWCTSTMSMRVAARASASSACTRAPNVDPRCSSSRRRLLEGNRTVGQSMRPIRLFQRSGWRRCGLPGACLAAIPTQRSCSREAEAERRPGHRRPAALGSGSEDESTLL